MRKSISIPVTEPTQVGEARRAALRLGSDLGLNQTALGNLGIIVTELGTNLHKHAKRGELIVRGLKCENNQGVEILSVDRGPGMTEVFRCLQDGYSTSGTSGNGLGSIRRLSDVFDVYSTTQGSVLVSQLWDRGATALSAVLTIGAVCLPYPGENLCGDAWSWVNSAPEHSIILADGLGHGKEAAEASDLAISIFEEQVSPLSAAQSLQRIHGALRSTRGAAALILNLGTQSRKIICSGIGNISGSIVKASASKNFVSLNGTVGHQAQRFQEFNYEWSSFSLIVCHSDGLQTKWKLDAYPGLQMRHPSLIAAVLYRDFRRERDDVTVLVVRESTKKGAT